MMACPNFKILASRKNLLRGLFVVLGGVAGYAYYHFVGCTGNTCPITGNPYHSTLFGGVMGLLLSYVREG